MSNTGSEKAYLWSDGISRTHPEPISSQGNIQAQIGELRSRVTKLENAISILTGIVMGDDQ